LNHPLPISNGYHSLKAPPKVVLYQEHQILFQTVKIQYLHFDLFFVLSKQVIEHERASSFENQVVVKKIIKIFVLLQVKKASMTDNE
jgi:hypothetical protein